MKEDQLIKAMLAEFDLPPEVAAKHRAWGALGSLADGAPMEDITLVYGFTAEQLEPYRAEWEQMHAQSNG